MIDAFNILNTLTDRETLADRNRLLGPDDAGQKAGRGLGDLQIDQIEFANVLIINKVDLLPDSEREETVKKIKDLLFMLNPKAKVIVPAKPKFKGFDVSQVINTRLFDMEKASSSPEWMQELAKPHHTPETEEHGITSLVFREHRRPFHPTRLRDILYAIGHLQGGEATSHTQKVFEGVVRSKGRLWAASVSAFRMMTQTAGVGHLDISVGPLYLCTTPEWMMTLEEKERSREQIQAGRWGKYGDRSSELICIGVGLDKQSMLAALNSALLSEEEFQKGPKYWMTLPDPIFNGRAADICKDYHGV